jgi:hypothetical protein
MGGISTHGSFGLCQKSDDTSGSALEIPAKRLLPLGRYINGSRH